jgi:hypothetical protein
MVCIFDPACELLPPWMKELYGTCVPLPLYCTFSLTSSSPHSGPYSAGVLHSVSDQIQNLQIALPPQTKMTSKDDIKGLVSLKFLRPWCKVLKRDGQAQSWVTLNTTIGPQNYNFPEERLMFYIFLTYRTPMDVSSIPPCAQF